MSCSICIEKYNKSKRKSVTCIYCSESACFDCVKKYLLSTVIEPHCMFCKKIWEDKSLVSLLNRSFVFGELKAHHSKIYLDREKHELNRTQLAAKRTIKLNTRITQRREVFNEIQDLNQRIKSLKIILGDMSREILDLQRKVSFDYVEPTMEQNLPSSLIPNEVRKKNEEKIIDTFVIPCPIEICRGFVDLGWSCRMCDTNVCKQCHKITNEEHKCDPGDIESVKLIMKETRNCPKCRVKIYKISGCNQMWCVSCNTPFDWKTGQIIKGQIHNPHYFEYLQNNGLSEQKDINDRNHRIGYGDLRFMRTRNIISRDQERFLYTLLQEKGHFEDHNLNDYRDRTDKSLHSLRIKYLIGEIDEEKWKSRISNVFVDKRYKQRMYEIISDYMRTFDILIDNITNSRSNREFNELLKQFLDIYFDVKLKMNLITGNYNRTAVEIFNETTRDSIQDVYNNLLLELRTNES